MSRDPPEQMIAALEAAFPPFAGKRTIDIPDLATHRLKYRRRFYRFADGFFGLSIFHWIVAEWALWDWQAIAHRIGFVVTFLMMFFCEFRARAMTRQLHRRAAEQFARDLLDLRDEWP